MKRNIMFNDEVLRKAVTIMRIEDIIQSEIDRNFKSMLLIGVTIFFFSPLLFYSHTVALTASSVIAAQFVRDCSNLKQIS